MMMTTMENELNFEMSQGKKVQNAFPKTLTIENEIFNKNYIYIYKYSKTDDNIFWWWVQAVLMVLESDLGDV